jgi:hypothetical protein
MIAEGADHARLVFLGDVQPSGRRAMTRPEPTRPEKRKPAYIRTIKGGDTFKTVTIHNPLAFDKTDGGIILSGPNDCRGSTNLH